MAKKRKAEEETSSSSSSEEEETPGTSSSSSEEEEDDDDDSSSSSSSSEDDDESSKREKLRKLLEPLSKDQILGLLNEAALQDPFILSRIVQKVDSDPTHRKIFIHGLGWDATEEQVLQVFKPFGEIEDFKLITDKVTGRAKGYAFVLFKTRAAAEKALRNPQKKIGNRTTTCQLAALGPAAAAGEVSKRKLFVANVGPNVNVDRLRAFFGQFGEIEEGPMGLDPTTNKPRGFVIFVYKFVDGLKKALEEPQKSFEGCQLLCKKFVEGLNTNTNHKNVTSNQQQSEVSYGYGVNPGVLGSNLNAGSFLMPQNPGIGLVGNPLMAAALNQSALAASGLGGAVAGIGGNYGINSYSPSVIGGYGSQAALLGLGAYQSAQTGQSSVGANAPGAAVGTESVKAQSGVGKSGMALPSWV
ncbi:hypothetical protein ACH5RR_025259 [Cinchona calisaya]|uniref:RRM domain-containing protein n=1 Tax=Cinchona calisaya TaxID=153742 RepID=A0ABD2Z2A6_9GENT